ncbi:MAG: TonB-dependent receptor [Bacteroidota bacterium]
MKTLSFSVLILCALLTFPALSQEGSCNGKIIGKVLDEETKEPLPFSTIQVVNSSIGEISDANGNFTLTNICGDFVEFEVRFLGYKTAVHNHDFRTTTGSKTVHRIYLTQDDNMLESVVIEGEEIVGQLESMSVEKIDKSQLEVQTTQSLASAIGDLQGVSFTSVGSNVQLPIIHGLYGNRILIINNGVKHGFQNWGAENAPEIDINSAESVSVIKGAAGVRYGPEALGGVVLIEGNPLELSNDFYLGVSTGYQTNGRGYFGNAYLGQGFGNFSFHVGGNYERVGDRFAPNYDLQNTGMNEISGNLGLRYNFDNWDIKGYYNYVRQDLGIYRWSVANSFSLFSRLVARPGPDDPNIRDFSYDIDEPRQEARHHLAKVETEWFTSLGRFFLLVSYQNNTRREFDVRRNADRPIIDLTLETTDNRLEWDHPSLGKIEGTVGVQYFSQNNDNNPGTGNVPFIPNYNNNRFSAFAIESLEAGKNTFEIGLRFDHEFNSVRGREQDQSIFRNEFSFTNVTTSLGWVSDFAQGWQFRSNIGTAWRTPNMAELYTFGGHGYKLEYGLWRYQESTDGGISTDNILSGEDKDVKAEKSYKWTNEISYRKGGKVLTFTGYVNYIDDFIFDRPFGVGNFRWVFSPAYIYDQSDALFIGGDLTYRWQINKNLNTTLGGSFLWSENAARSEPLINQPPTNLNLEVSWQTPRPAFLDQSKITLQAAYLFEQFQAPRTIAPELLDGDPNNGEVEVDLASEIFDFKDPPSGYFLANARWEWKYARLGGQVEVRNIFNTSYRDYLNQMRLFIEDLGRNIQISLNYKL